MVHGDSRRRPTHSTKQLGLVLRYVNPYDNLVRQDFIYSIEYDIGISGSSLAVNNLTEKAYDGGRQYGRHY